MSSLYLIGRKRKKTKLGNDPRRYFQVYIFIFLQFKRLSRQKTLSGKQENQRDSGNIQNTVPIHKSENFVPENNLDDNFVQEVLFFFS